MLGRPSVGSIAMPLCCRLRGDDSYIAHHQLRAHEQPSAEQPENLANDKLRRLIGYARDRAPYYTRLLDDLGPSPERIRTADDLPKLAHHGQAYADRTSGRTDLDGSG